MHFSINKFLHLCIHAFLWKNYLLTKFETFLKAEETIFKKDTDLLNWFALSPFAIFFFTFPMYFFFFFDRIYRFSYSNRRFRQDRLRQGLGSQPVMRGSPCCKWKFVVSHSHAAFVASRSPMMNTADLHITYEWCRRVTSMIYDSASRVRRRLDWLAI